MATPPLPREVTGDFVGAATGSDLSLPDLGAHSGLEASPRVAHETCLSTKMGLAAAIAESPRPYIGLSPRASVGIVSVSPRPSVDIPDGVHLPSRDFFVEVTGHVVNVDSDNSMEPIIQVQTREAAHEIRAAELGRQSRSVIQAMTSAQESPEALGRRSSTRAEAPDAGGRRASTTAGSPATSGRTAAMRAAGSKRSSGRATLRNSFMRSASGVSEVTSEPTAHVRASAGRGTPAKAKSRRSGRLSVARKRVSAMPSKRFSVQCQNLAWERGQDGGVLELEEVRDSDEEESTLDSSDGPPSVASFDSLDLPRRTLSVRVSRRLFNIIAFMFGFWGFFTGCLLAIHVLRYVTPVRRQVQDLLADVASLSAEASIVRMLAPASALVRGVALAGRSGLLSGSKAGFAGNATLGISRYEALARVAAPEFLANPDLLSLRVDGFADRQVLLRPGSLHNASAPLSQRLPLAYVLPGACEFDGDRQIALGCSRSLLLANRSGLVGLVEPAYNYPACAPGCLVNNGGCPSNLSCHQVQDRVYKIDGQCYRAYSDCLGCLKDPSKYPDRLILQPTCLEDGIAEVWGPPELESVGTDGATLLGAQQFPVLRLTGITDVGVDSQGTNAALAVDVTIGLQFLHAATVAAVPKEGVSVLICLSDGAVLASSDGQMRLIDATAPPSLVWDLLPSWGAHLTPQLLVGMGRSEIWRGNDLLVVLPAVSVDSPLGSDTLRVVIVVPRTASAGKPLDRFMFGAFGCAVLIFVLPVLYRLFILVSNCCQCCSRRCCKGRKNSPRSSSQRGSRDRELAR